MENLAEKSLFKKGGGGGEEDREELGSHHKRGRAARCKAGLSMQTTALLLINPLNEVGGRKRR